MDRLALAFVLLVLAGHTLAREPSNGEVEKTLPPDPNSQIGATVKLSPKMRVVPREESVDAEAQAMKELQELLRDYHRGGIRSRPLD